MTTLLLCFFLFVSGLGMLLGMFLVFSRNGIPQAGIAFSLMFGVLGIITCDWRARSGGAPTIVDY